MECSEAARLVLNTTYARLYRFFAKERYFLYCRLITDICKLEFSWNIGKPAFTSHHSLFQFIRLAFGLNNTPRTFQRAMNILLTYVKWRLGLVFKVYIVNFFVRQTNISNMFEKYWRYYSKVLHWTWIRRALYGSHRVFQSCLLPWELGSLTWIIDTICRLEDPTTLKELQSFYPFAKFSFALIPIFLFLLLC